MRNFIRLSALFIALLGALLFSPGGGTTVHAQTLLPTSEASIPASQILNPDGTLNLQNGTNGSVNLAGWRVALDPQRGPVFAPNTPTAAGWSGLDQGIFDRTFASAMNGSALYAGGFSGDVWKWDGSGWWILSYPANGEVDAIAVSGSDIYVGGNFTQICGDDACDSGNLTVNHIARWNGSGWWTMGYGVSDAVTALAVQGSDLYVGGRFAEVCGNLACSSGNSKVGKIAKWNGSSWAALSHGLTGEVHALAAAGNDVYAAGDFDVACDSADCGSGNLRLNNIAKWNGSSWSALGDGLMSNAFALAVNGSDVYVGGAFTQTCGDTECLGSGLTVNHIAKWNGSSWSALGHGVNAAVNALAASGSDVYAGGTFAQVCGNTTCDSGNLTVNNTAKWNGSAWSQMGDGLNDVVYALAVKGSDVYAGGKFTQVCGNPACSSGNVTVNHIAKYSTTAPCAKPAKPALKSPANSAKVKKAKLILQWNTSNCAQTYNVTVQDATTGKSVEKKTGLHVLTDKPSAVVKGKTYKWFVQACDSKGCTKSQVWRFTVK